MKKMCDVCPLRGAYDKNRSSLIGRFWRWHIDFCPGWKKYYNTLTDTQKEELKELYNYPKR